MDHSETAQQDTQRWLERAVIGLNLCPFAKSVHVNGRIRYLVSAAATPELLLKLVEQMQETPFDPLDPARFAKDLAARINELMADPTKRMAFGKAGRQRAIDVFSWSAIARQTRDLYEVL